jgi:hypothetical protein
MQTPKRDGCAGDRTWNHLNNQLVCGIITDLYKNFVMHYTMYKSKNIPFLLGHLRHKIRTVMVVHFSQLLLWWSTCWRLEFHSRHHAQTGSEAQSTVVGVGWGWGWGLSLGISGRTVKLTTHVRIVPILKLTWNFTSNSPYVLLCGTQAEAQLHIYSAKPQTIQLERDNRLMRYADPMMDTPD